MEKTASVNKQAIIEEIFDLVNNIKPELNINFKATARED